MTIPDASPVIATIVIIFIGCLSNATFGFGAALIAMPLMALFLDLKTQGYARFNLGMAPMSGFQEHENPSVEEKMIHAFFQHTNFLFSYRGLKRYKSKFATSWEPRYAIYKTQLDLPRLALALRQVSELRAPKRTEPESPVVDESLEDELMFESP